MHGGRAAPVLRRDIHAQPRAKGELGDLLADGHGHHLLGAVPPEVVLGQTVQQFVTVSKQEEVQDEDSQVLQITVLHVHGGCIIIRQVLDTGINFLLDDGVFVVALHHHDVSEADEHHLHQSCPTQASNQNLKLNSINFIQFEYNTVKFKSCYVLHSPPVFCSTKVAEMVTNEELGQLGSIVHRDVGGKPALKMVGQEEAHSHSGNEHINARKVKVKRFTKLSLAVDLHQVRKSLSTEDQQRAVMAGVGEDHQLVDAVLRGGHQDVADKRAQETAGGPVVLDQVMSVIMMRAESGSMIFSYAGIGPRSMDPVQGDIQEEDSQIQTQNK